MMDVHELTSAIKDKARQLGFSAVGIARACQVDSIQQEAYLRWIKDGCNGSMEYLERNMDLRFDPRKLVENAKSIVMVAMNYYPQRMQADDTLKIAWYAYGKDYHDIMRQRLRSLLEHVREIVPDANGRAFADSAPFMERYWAEKAGIGFRGINQQLIIPGASSEYFLGELLLDISLEPDEPLDMSCLECGACIKACPTGAIEIAEDRTARLDARKCISYLTIESRDQIPEEYATLLDDMIYGCDRCQKACPYTRRQKATEIAELMPSPELLGMSSEDWKDMDIDTYRRLFKGSAIKRAKFEGLRRNIDTVTRTGKQD